MTVKVKMDIKVTATGETIDEAIEKAMETMQDATSVFNATKDEKESFIKGYHYWDDENEGDVDWFPLKWEKNNGCVLGIATMNIQNVR